MAKRKISPLVAGLAGVAVGASAVALSNKNTRKKIVNTAKSVTRKGQKIAKDLSSQAKKSLKNGKKIFK